MTALTLDEVIEIANYKPEDVVQQPQATVSNQSVRANYVGLRRVKVEGFWKNHIPYRIAYTIQADKLGGIKITLGVAPFWHLYDRNAQSETLSTHLQLHGDKEAQKEETLNAIKYLVRLLSKEVSLTRKPPKKLTREELIHWTAENALVNKDFVNQSFTKWGWTD